MGNVKIGMGDQGIGARGMTGSIPGEQPKGTTPPGGVSFK